LLYKFFQIPARIAFYIWCRKIIINNKSFLKCNGPLLIAANHPNSFLDAILLCSIFKQPIYSLARGDVFKNNFVNKILRSLNMLPVYRVSEGVENLEENYKTFDDCINIFKQNGIILIFSEGKCVNEWNLRPLKKGTARLAMTAWEQGIPLKVLPLGINYNSFTSFGKNIQLNFGDVITESNVSFSGEAGFGNKVQIFNKILLEQLQQLVINIKPVDAKIVKEKFEVTVNPTKKILLFVPACVGYILHMPLYIPVKKIAFAKFGKIDHYDSVMMGMLFFLYPIYVGLFFLLFYFLHFGLFSLLTFIIIPFTAWSFVQLKNQF
jgi:1-acyl-sn-glycerol-3-phosphate acyltransferase